MKHQIQYKLACIIVKFAYVMRKVACASLLLLEMFYNHRFMHLAVHDRVMMHLGSLESTPVAPRATLTPLFLPASVTFRKSAVKYIGVFKNLNVGNSFKLLYARWLHGNWARLRFERSGFEPWPGTLCCVLGQDA